MSRKDKHEAAEKRRVELVNGWTGVLKEDLIGGMSYTDAVDKLSAAIDDLIRKEPHKAQEIRDAWNGLCSKIKTRTVFS